MRNDFNLFFSLLIFPVRSVAHSYGTQDYMIVYCVYELICLTFNDEYECECILFLLPFMFVMIKWIEKSTHIVSLAPCLFCQWMKMKNKKNLMKKNTKHTYDEECNACAYDIEWEKLMKHSKSVNIFFSSSVHFKQNKDSYNLHIKSYEIIFGSVILALALALFDTFIFVVLPVHNIIRQHFIAMPDKCVSFNIYYWCWCCRSAFGCCSCCCWKNYTISMNGCVWIFRVCG